MQQEAASAKAAAALVKEARDARAANTAATQQARAEKAAQQEATRVQAEGLCHTLLKRDLLDLEKPLPSKKDMLNVIKSLGSQLEGTDNSSAAEGRQAQVATALKVGKSKSAKEIARAYNVLVTECRSKSRAGNLASHHCTGCKKAGLFR